MNMYVMKCDCYFVGWESKFVEISPWMSQPVKRLSIGKLTNHKIWCAMLPNKPQNLIG